MAAAARWFSRRIPARSAAGWILLTSGVLMIGCVGSRGVDRPPDDRYGHRAEEEPDRRTIAISAPDTNISYFYYPAAFDTVHVRPAPFSTDLAQNDRVPVEILVKGSFPDACSALHDVSQERYGHIVEVKLRTRRPQGAVCASVLRPYRFYLDLEGLYEPGSYTLKLNGRIIPFSVRSANVG